MMALANLNEDLLFSSFGIFKLLSSRVNILREQNSTSSTICVDIQTSIGKVQVFMEGVCDGVCGGVCGRVCVVGCMVECGERVCCEGLWWSVWWSVWEGVCGGMYGGVW